MKRSVDWRLLGYFRVVGRHQHVSHAAAEFGTSQPALSRAVARFETKIGVKLFDRAGRSVALSEEGRILLQVVERAYGEIEEIQLSLPGSAAATRKPVALGFVRTLGAELVPQTVAAFKQENPGVDFTFFANNGPTIVDALDHGELDLIFTALPVNNPRVTWKKVIDQELVVIVARGSSLTKQRSVQLNSLADIPFVTFKRGHLIRELTEVLCSLAGFVPRISFEGDDSRAIPGFVAAGFGVGVLPLDGNLPNSVAILATDRPLMLRPMGLAWIEDRFLHANARVFREFILKGDRCLS